MKQNQIKDLPNLSIENYENIFNVYREDDGMYYYNLLNTIVFPPNLPSSAFRQYTIQYGDTWPYISYKAYKTPNLWWLILLANEIINPINSVIVGEQILIPIEAVVKEVLSQLTK